ncbi:MAG: hypothetical protein NT150_05105 [Bacteroidetes bacterium]|nr:hypothetical protein [Bacteroidota bacterium]
MKKILSIGLVLFAAIIGLSFTAIEDNIVVKKVALKLMAHQ